MRACEKREIEGRWLRSSVEPGVVFYSRFKGVWLVLFCCERVESREVASFGRRLQLLEALIGAKEDKQK